MQVFMVTGLFAGQHNTALHGTIRDVIYTNIITCGALVGKCTMLKVSF